MESQAEVTWIEEVGEQSFDTDVFGACSTNTFSLSDYWGNRGYWCTLTHECMSWCK
ncbi:lichenicidin alpha family lanthipeptide [Actinomyces sp. Z3]|uniref:lichenicidin alpha family lanthipeptide n=1 Tax=unclassified Actinomyces TaxID=2609248 RepID=UPI000D59A7A6|nr:plantaricin C family lantibiotic [Actinomyces sp. Z3]